MYAIRVTLEDGTSHMVFRRYSLFDELREQLEEVYRYRYPRTPAFTVLHRAGVDCSDSSIHRMRLWSLGRTHSRSFMLSPARFFVLRHMSHSPGQSAKMPAACLRCRRKNFWRAAMYAKLRRSVSRESTPSWERCARRPSSAGQRGRAVGGAPHAEGGV